LTCTGKGRTVPEVILRSGSIVQREVIQANVGEIQAGKEGK